MREGGATLRADVSTMLREQLEYRELLAALVRRDLILRYKQTVIGFGWAILMPFLSMLIFTVIFTRVVRLETGVPYPVFVYAGLLPWNLFASSLRFSARSLAENQALVKNVYFPREVFPFAAILVSLVDFAVASTVLVALMAYYGIGVSWTALLIPVVLLIQVLFTAGIALLLAMANLFYRDFRYVFEVLLTVWMFATSVVYPVSYIGGRLGEILQLNPMTPIIEAYRSLLLRGELPPLSPLLVAAAISTSICALAWIAFHRSEHLFAENV